MQPIEEGPIYSGLTSGRDQAIFDSLQASKLVANPRGSPRNKPVRCLYSGEAGQSIRPVKGMDLS